QVLAQYGGLETALGKGQPVDTLATDNALWAITAEDGRLWRLDTQASVGVSPRSNTLDGPHLAGLPDSSFFLSDPARRTILYHKANGEPLRQFAFAERFIAPTGVAATQIEDLVYLAVADSQACSLSLWRAHIGTLLLPLGG